jgi:putative tRNA adenosine deaminase-associated protein
VAYLGALLSRTTDGWQATEVDLDTVDDLAGMAELMRENSVDDETVLLLVEQEDVWFGVVRIDGEDDPRVFVSDGAAALRSAYSDLVTATLVVGANGTADDHVDTADDVDDDLDEAGGENDRGGDEVDDELDDDSVDDIDDVLPDTVSELDEPDRPVGPGPFGDTALLADLGLSASELTELCGGSVAPSDALGELAEALGAADELEAVR